MIATANSAISNLLANYPSMDALEALREAYYLTAPYDLLSFDSFSSVSRMVLNLATSGGATVSQETLEAAIKVLSNLSKIRLSSEAEQRELTNTVSETTSQIIKANLASNPVVETDEIKVRVEEFMSSQTAIVAPSSDESVIIPPGVSQCEGGSSKLSTISYKALTYSWRMNDNQLRDSSVFSVKLYCDAVKERVTNLEDEIRLEFIIRSRRGLELLGKLNSGEITQKQAIDAEFFECRFYDEASDSLSSEGCRVVRIT